MDAYPTSEFVLSFLKKSISESPFSVSIQIKKSFNKNQDGSRKVSGIKKHESLEDDVKTLKSLLGKVQDENFSFKMALNARNNMFENLQSENQNLKCEKDNLGNELHAAKVLLSNRYEEIMKIKEISKNQRKERSRLDKIAEKKFIEAHKEIESKDREINDLASALASSSAASRPVPISAPLVQVSACASSSTETTSSISTSPSPSTDKSIET